MNCANHPETPVSAYCQNCGKPLCEQCVRSVAGVVYCEPCLAARLHPGATGPASSGGWAPVAGTTPMVGLPPRPGSPNPVIAGLLGTIPGVGAMYNGQFVKAFAHVIIFVVLVGAADHFGPAGILIAAWFFYQVFDAVQTAIARRDGRPLPDPLGLNDLGQRLGVQPPAPVAYAPPVATTGTYASEGVAPAPGAPAGGTVGPPPGWDAWGNPTAASHADTATGVPVGAEYVQPVQQTPSVPIPPPLAYVVGRPEPIGAIVLIAVGMLFLLSTLGVFRVDWIGRGWPVLIIALGAWLLFRRVRSVPPAGGGL